MYGPFVSMAPPSFNIFRSLRLQLKTGFIRKEPVEYNFMKRYPPLTRDSVPQFHKFTKKHVPYMNLYEKAISKHPKYDESIYPAYWQQEPLALILAKKQYLYMQQGDSEEVAFRKAEEYVDEVENKSYVELLAITETLDSMHVKPPFLANNAIAHEIAHWKQILHATNYEDLQPADQGEVDYLIQTKILKWNEVQRERRMKDVIFYNEFQKLREALFPCNEATQRRLKRESDEEFRSFYFKIRKLDPSKLTTAAPFYIEDYLSLFQKMSLQPNLKQWSIRDLNHLSDWIENTLALRQIVEKRPYEAVQRYLDQLRNTFFPMLQYKASFTAAKGVATTTSTYPVPTVADIKKVLYHNQVGYRVEDGGKVFVKRFYRIPSLLFPKETFTTNLMNDQDKLE